MLMPENHSIELSKRKQVRERETETEMTKTETEEGRGERKGNHENNLTV